MDEFILFIMTFLFLLFFYQLFFVLPNKKKFKNKEERKELLEIRYLQMKYHLNLEKISYYQLLQICSIVSSLDISIVVGVVSEIESFWIKILVGFLLIFSLIVISYHFVYLFYKRKGMILNG